MHARFELDSSFFGTLPSLSWEAAIKATRVEIELLTDFNMITFYENGIRGGIARATRNYAKVNNKYMYDYDKSEKVHSF